MLASPIGIDLLDRRRFLSRLGLATGGTGLLHLLGQSTARAEAEPWRPHWDAARPAAARPPHFEPRAKRLLVIFCVGAVSHVDSFDYKPALLRAHGQDAPGTPAVTFQGPAGKLARPFWTFRPRGKSGKMISDLFPDLGELADELCFVHSVVASNSAHTQAENFMVTGQAREGFPSLGSWVTYALGSESQELPAFVAIADPRGRPQAGGNNWGSGYLPPAFQGTAFSARHGLRNISAPSHVSSSSNQAARALLERLNEEHLEKFPGDADLTARIASFELAGRMQLSIPKIGDLSREPLALLDRYGTHSANSTKAAFARNCLLARRLLESGVRVVQLFNGGSGDGGRDNWDSHTEIQKKHGEMAGVFDQPAAALLRDLRDRGLLNDTLVVWCTEFGRLPFLQANGTGRDHNIQGFTCWLAGAGVRSGFSYGATDELGWKATENPVSVYDLNATILHLLGLDHERLTFAHNGVERRLTDVHGEVIRAVIR